MVIAELWPVTSSSDIQRIVGDILGFTCYVSCDPVLWQTREDRLLGRPDPLISRIVKYICKGLITLQDPYVSDWLGFAEYRA